MPINYPLFERLRSVDPGCSVSSENEPAVYSLPSAAVGFSRSGAYGHVSSWGECYRMNCPICGDRKQHLFFCHLAGAVARTKERKTPVKFSSSLCVCHRQRCHTTEPFRKWRASLGIEDLPSLDFTKGGLVQSKMAHGICMDVEDVLPHPTYPLLSSGTPGHVRDWLAYERRYDPGYLGDMYGVGFAPAGAVFENRAEPDPDKRWRAMYSDRLIIPVVQGMTLVGWQARVVGSDKAKVKYLTSPNMSKSSVLYGLDRAMMRSHATLVEGVFDAWRVDSVGGAGVAVFGHSLSAVQRLQLKAVYGRSGGLSIMFDAEPAVNECASAIAEQLAGMADGIFPRGVVPKLLDDGKDPDGRGDDELAAILAGIEASLGPVHRGKVGESDLLELSRGFDELYGDAEGDE